MSGLLKQTGLLKARTLAKSAASGGADSQPTTPATGRLFGTTKSKMANDARGLTVGDISLGGEIFMFAEDASEYRLKVDNRYGAPNASHDLFNVNGMSVVAELENMLTGLRIRIRWSGAATGTIPGTPAGSTPTPDSGTLESDAVLPSQFGLAVFPKGGLYRVNLCRAISTVANAVFTGSMSGLVLTVTAITSGYIVKGQNVTGASVASGQLILDQISGTPGGVGTYALKTSNAAASTTMTATDAMPWGSTNGALSFEGEYEYQYLSTAYSFASTVAAYFDAASRPVTVGTNATTKQTGTLPTVPVTTGAASSNSCHGGIYHITRAVRPFRSNLFIGNSIPDGSTDTTVPAPTRSGNGVWGRAITDSYGVPIGGMCKATISGDRLRYLVGAGIGGSNNVILQDLLRYQNHTHIGEAFHNDAAAATGTDAAIAAAVTQMIADANAVATAAKASGAVTVTVSRTTPFTTSSDGWTTPGGQTVVLNFGVGGKVRDAINTQIAATVGPGRPIDFVIDWVQALEEPTDRSKWRSDFGAGTGEGIHGLPPAYIAAAPFANAGLLLAPPAAGGR